MGSNANLPTVHNKGDRKHNVTRSIVAAKKCCIAYMNLMTKWDIYQFQFMN